MEKKNKIKTLGTDSCENVDTLYINKIKIWPELKESVYCKISVNM